MPLASDIPNANETLTVNFYTKEEGDYKGQPFVKIMIPGDQTNIIDQPVREHHKRSYPRQWLAFQMEASGDLSAIGTPLSKWNADAPADFNRDQMAEMQILKFQTVEQIATASDGQLQRVGMGGFGVREKARLYLQSKNQSESTLELAKTRGELDELKAQMAQFLASQQDKRGPGRPKKDDVNVNHDIAAIGAAGNG